VNVLRSILSALSRLRSPLLIGGVALLALYALLSKVIATIAFQPLTQQGSYNIVHLILDKVFLIALVAIVLSIIAYLVPKIVPRSFLEPVARVDYGFTVLRLFNPADDRLAAVLSQLEPYPGFPYFSRESDHPSVWPPRVWKDRDSLKEKFNALYLQKELQARLSNSPDFNPKSVEMMGGSDDPANEREQWNYVLSARSHLHQLYKTGGEESLSALLGPFFDPFMESESARAAMVRHMPNRVAVVRLANNGRIDVPNLGVEFEIAGELYDCYINADPEKVRNSHWDSAPARISFDQLPRGYTVEIRIFYSYQSLDEKVFPDLINYIQEITQGIRIANFAATNTQVRFDPEMVEKIPAYERLYLGDARKKDNYDSDLKRLSAQRSAAFEAAQAGKPKYEDTHLSMNDLPLSKLAALGVEQQQLDSIWVTFLSPANHPYTAVHVFTHPKGPYILLSSTGKDESDLMTAAGALAIAWKLAPGEAQKDTPTDRIDDICITVNVPGGFAPESILAACEALQNSGYLQFSVSKVHYHTEDAA
jgi:hypothetical protein